MSKVRLIDAHDFWARLPRNAENITIADITEALGGTPTIDAVEVVRCKECIHYKEKGYDKHPYCYYFDEPWSPSRGILSEPDDYCSRGELR